MATKTPKSPATGDYSAEFITRTVTLRGKRYVVRELTVAKYDDLVAQATSKNEANEELIDNQLLRRLVTIHSVVEPKFASLSSLGLRLTNKLINIAQDVNYGVEPEESDADKEPDIQEGEPEEEGEG